MTPLRIDGARAATLAKAMIDSLAWRADDVTTLYVTEIIGSISRRVGFALTAFRRHWGDDFVEDLASAP